MLRSHDVPVRCRILLLALIAHSTFRRETQMMIEIFGQRLLVTYACRFLCVLGDQRDNAVPFSPQGTTTRLADRDKERS